MKKLLLSVWMLGSFAAVRAQVWSGPTNPVAPTFRFGNVGIGAAAPVFPLHITSAAAAPAANAQGWRRGILLENSSTLYWRSTGQTANCYFMGHASSSPAGDFYQGYSAGIGPAAAVTYASKVYVTSAPAFMPQGSTQIFKNLLVQEAGFNRRLGVNILNPKRTADFLFAGAPQLRLTHTQNNSAILGIYTDFETTALGHMIIRPRSGILGRNVGIDVTTAPTHKLDVQGNARLRNVPNTTNNYLMTGTIQGGANDIAFSKLAFTGNPLQVLLGNGTWGPIPSSVASANNGLSVSGTFVQLGQNCNQTGAPAALLNPREIPMANQAIYFTGQGTPTTNAIGLGYAACAAMPAKLSTLQENVTPVTVSTIAGSFINRDVVAGGSSATILGVAGVSNQVQPAGNTTNMGGRFIAANAPLNIGISVNANGNASSASSIAGQFFANSTNPGTNMGVVTRVNGAAMSNYGALTSGSGGTDSYGLSTSAGGASNNNYGVQTSANGGTNSYGIYAANSGVSPNHWAGWFQGDVMVTGIGVIPGGAWTPSDKNYKTDIKKLEKVTDKISRLSGYTYYFKTEEFKDEHFPETQQIGLIAQELKEEFPQLVKEYKDGHYIVNYDGMVPVLLQAIKEQQQQIEELKSSVKNMAGSIPEDGNSNGRAIGSVTLNDAQSIVLEQNVPNPFAEQTSISYILTDGVQKAQLLFYNMDGKLINSSDLKPTAGPGVLNVFASDLSNGIYTYTLVADGKIIESKRMVKNK